MFQEKVGGYTGTGVLQYIPLGFKPKYVKVYNNSDAGSLWATMEWWEGMAAASALKTQKVIDSGATGLSSSAKVTSNGISQWAGIAPGGALSLGTGAVTAGSAVVTGSSTQFLNGEISVGDLINVAGQTRKVVSIASATSLTCDAAFDVSGSGGAILNMSGKPAGFAIGADADINASTEAGFYIALVDA